MPVRGIGTDPVLPIGGLVSRLCEYTLATYTAAGTSAPADGDIVSFTTTNNRVVITPDDTTGVNECIGRVKGAPNTTDLTVNVEFLNVLAFVELATDDLSTCTVANAAIKDGNTTVVNNFDAGSTTGPLKVVAKSGTAGAGTICCAVVI